MEDKLLVLRCKRGSREALTRIYQKYKADLLFLAMALLSDKTAAEDVVHDVFLSFVRDLDAFRLGGSLKGYLLTCTANHAKNWNKADRRRLRSTSEPAYPITDVAEAPLESLVCNEQLSRLGSALAELPFDQREVVVLHLHGGMTFQDIAGVRGISTNTAKSRYRYGLDKLRLLLNGQATR
jgi:RNA polymerase sigma factor (sigma-70 family)